MKSNRMPPLQSAHSIDPVCTLLVTAPSAVTHSTYTIAHRNNVQDVR